MNPFLPRQIDNTYNGHKVALWLFGLLVFMRTAMSVNSIFFGDRVASSADGIPLATYGAGAASTVVSLFAMLGLSNLMMCIFCIVVLVRYRALIPFMFTLLLFQHVSRSVIHQYLPIVRTGTPPASVINLVLATLMVLGLVLSLWRRKARRAASGTTTG